MDKPNLSTYRVIVPLIYSWSTPDIPKYEGWEKIGATTRGDAEARISEQAAQLSIEKKTNWVQRAMFTSAQGGFFWDTDFHDFLKRRGVERELEPKKTEWHKFSDTPKDSIDYFHEFASQQVIIDRDAIEEDYVLRPEQEQAIEQTLEVFADGYDEMLWNAKPRFGKTLTAYDLMRRMEAKTVLIVTNRPAVANSWYDDFAKFIAHQAPYCFISESDSLAKRNPMSREEFRKYLVTRSGEDIRRIEFVSLQDLKGSERFGGKYDKNKYISELNWDLLIVDEAHEGVDTLKTDVAFDQIKRDKTLHLSGTPFKALASGKFSKEQIYNWTYEDEQEAKRNWDDPTEDNPYESLPTLNLYTYQMSRMIEDRLDAGVAASDDPDAENIDFAFNLNEFFATKDNGFFEHEDDVRKFLDRLTENEKYPFSTPELRDEIRHSFWLLDRVASAVALKKLLNDHPVFKDYEVILAAGDRRDDADTEKVGKALDQVKSAIKHAEATDGKTITLSVGQLTTGVTIPEWTAVMMLSNIKSPALYMQSAFRAQNPCTFERGGHVFEKQNAYVFDFAPERTLITFDEFANNLNPTPIGDPLKRQENIATLLNFFPVIGEDSDGEMTLLNAEQVLTFPQAFKAREVVRRGFMSNLLFDNIAGIFRHAEYYKEVLEKLPTAKQGKIRQDEEIKIPEPPPTVDDDGVATADKTVINKQAKKLGKPVWKYEDVADIEPETPTATLARQVAAKVSAKTRETRENARKEYGITVAQTNRDDRRIRLLVEEKVKRVKMNHDIAMSRIEDEIKEAPTQAKAEELEAKKAATREELKEDIFAIVEEVTESLAEQLATREENKKVQSQADKTMEETRAHLRGFARTIPMFIMAYGDRDLKLSNFDDYTPDHIFEEITGITEEEFRFLRDGREVVEEDGTTVQIPGLFDAGVFDQSVQEFLDKKEALADYFDPGLTENIFAYIPQQKTSLVFTPEPVVKQMVDILEEVNPGIFSDPTKTFADLFSTAGLFLMEIVRRLDAGLQDKIPDQRERLRHILTSQVFEMAHNELLHRITIEAVSGGVERRKQWMEESGHFRFGNIARMTPEQLQQVVDDMLAEGLAMSKKFDVVIGNPPYQEEAEGTNTRDTPVYHLFMDAAYAVGTKAVLITPARFLFNAGLTPKAWNRKMLADPHLSIAHYARTSDELFPGTHVNGGIVVTYRDATRKDEPIKTFAKFPELNTILKKVSDKTEASFSTLVSSSSAHRWTSQMHEDNPRASELLSETAQFKVNTNAFEQLDFISHETEPDDGFDYTKVLGIHEGKRTYRWVRSDYITGPKSIGAHKVAVPTSRGHLGSLGDEPAVIVGHPLTLPPGVATTQSFLTIGSFKSGTEADACLRYVKSKFARTMLGILKATQHNPAATWEHVPLQDFTEDSDIDWTKPIPEIDQQLYAKYSLSDEEIEFIESHVKPLE